MPVTVWAMKEIVVSKIKKKKKNNTSSCGVHGLEGKARKNPVITTMCVGSGFVFLPSHIISDLAYQLRHLVDLPACLSDSTDLGHWISTWRTEVTHQAIVKQSLTDLALPRNVPSQTNERKERSVGFISRTKWWGWVLPLASGVFILGLVHEYQSRH